MFVFSDPDIWHPAHENNQALRESFMAPTAVTKELAVSISPVPVWRSFSVAQLFHGGPLVSVQGGFVQSGLAWFGAAWLLAAPPGVQWCPGDD